MDEYIGLRQFQTQPRTTAIVNRELACLSEEYRRSLFIDGHIISSYTPSPLLYMNEHDPWNFGHK
jgi:hypothetical protein